MIRRSPRFFFLAGFIGVTLLVIDGCTNSSPPTPTLAQPVIALRSTPPSCGGGPAATPQLMNANAQVLANLIEDLRNQAGVPILTTSMIDTGVAQWHAEDMAAQALSHSLELMERMFLGESSARGGAKNANTGVIAVGYSTDPQAVFAALDADPGARSLLVYNNFFFGNKIGIGYSGGYWMIILFT